MPSQAKEQYDDYTNLMQWATPEEPPSPPEDVNPFEYTNEVNPMDYAEGNDPNQLYMAKGGVVPNMGGMRRGPSGSTDTVPAMLTPEEYVVPRDVVLKKGTDFFDKIRDEARGMGKNKNSAGPQAVPGPQGEPRPGYEVGGLVNRLKDMWDQPQVQGVVDKATNAGKTLVSDLVNGINQGVPAAAAGMKKFAGDVVNQAKADYSQPTIEMPGWVPNATPKVGNVLLNPVARAAGMNTDFNKPAVDTSGYDAVQARLADRQAHPEKYNFDPEKRFTETPIGGGMTRKMITPEYNNYLNKGGKEPIVEAEQFGRPLPGQPILDVIPAGMSREQFAQNKLFDQYQGYAQREQEMAAKAAEADYARQAANTLSEVQTTVHPTKDGYISVDNVNKTLPGLISTATVKPGDFMSQQNILANNQLNNLTELQKEALKEQRTGLMKDSEEAKKAFAGLNSTLLGGWNSTKGEAVPGMAYEDPEQAANHFKNVITSHGVSSKQLDGLAIAMPSEGSNIMTIYDPQNVNGPKLQGTPAEIAEILYNDAHQKRR